MVKKAQIAINLDWTGSELRVENMKYKSSLKMPAKIPVLTMTITL